MGMRYNYDTRKIDRDFVLKKVWGSCYIDPEHTTLIGVKCKTCPHFIKMQKFYPSPKEQYILNLDDEPTTVVFCKYNKKDDEGLQDIIHKMYEDFEEEAITHFYD